MASPSRSVAAIEGSVRSADGTQIGYLRVGAGPALVLAHGSLSTSVDWLRVAESLATRFTCFVMDRRGRGMSGNAASYRIEREYEDIAAVLMAAGPAAALLGHSFGAICALGTALRSPVPRLVLYEPPLPVGGPVAGKYLDDYRDAVARSQFDEALAIGMARFVGLSSEQIGVMRTLPIWPYLSSLVPTWVRELEAIDALGTAISHYAAITCPTMLLVGDQSAEHPLKDASAALARILPKAQVVPLESQGHMAMRMAPQLLAEKIAEFLSEPI
jgi:pimeloyl-ACP methyl ester carboxylesterase